MKVVACLPTRNEVENIQYMIDRIKAFNYNLFICDEESSDGTIEIAKRNNIPVYQRDGSGKGYGIVKALEVAKEKGYDVLVMIDCDRTYPPEYIPKLLEFFSEYDMVVGKRSMSHIRFLHRLPNLAHTYLINLLYGAKLHDINSGLRAFKVDKLDLDAKGFDIEAQITIRAIKKGLKIKEIPIEYNQRKKGSKIRVMDGFLIFLRIIREKFIS